MRISSVIQEEIKTLYRNKMPLTEIARKYGYGLPEVTKVIFPNGEGPKVLPIVVSRHKRESIDKQKGYIQPEEYITKTSKINAPIETAPAAQKLNSMTPKEVQQEAGRKAYKKRLSNEEALREIKEKMDQKDQVIINLMVKAGVITPDESTRLLEPPVITDPMIRVDPKELQSIINSISEGSEYVSFGLQSWQVALGKLNAMLNPPKEDKQNP